MLLVKIEMMGFKIKVLFLLQNLMIMQDLYLFNPDNEISIANGTNGYTPKANISMMADNLAYLSAYLSDKEDYVLVSRIPNADFVKEKENIFGLNCKPIVWEQVCSLSFHEIKPWGWSPRVHLLVKDLKSRCCEQFKESVMAEWSDQRRALYSRQVASNCLSEIVQLDARLEKEIIPHVCDSLEKIKLFSKKVNLVVKAPWSSSGKGILFIPQGLLMRKEEEILSGILRKQGYVMVEKQLNKVLDFAMEFEMDHLFRLNFLGYSIFNTSKRGEYEGNIVASDDYLEQIIEKYIDKDFLREIRDQLTDVLLSTFRGRYVGCLGVDMMIYENESGEFKIQPCVEINLRYNMGIVAIVLRKYLQNNSIGKFNIRFSSNVGEVLQAVEANKSAYPLALKENHIESGYINLTPVTSDTHFVAELKVDAL